MSPESLPLGVSVESVPTTRGTGPTASAVVAVRKCAVALLIIRMMRKKL
jgi:hypothetical protein